MSEAGTAPRGPQPRPHPSSVRTSGARGTEGSNRSNGGSVKARTGAHLPLNHTLLDGSNTGLLQAAPSSLPKTDLIGQRTSLKELSTQLQNLCKPEQLNADNLVNAMAAVRSHQDVLQLDPELQDSSTIAALRQTHTDILAVLELWTTRVLQKGSGAVALPAQVKSVKQLLEGLGALIVNARKTVFANTPQQAPALKCMETLHAHLFDHVAKLDLSTARPSAVLSIVNEISRSWKIRLIEPGHPQATAIIAELPGIASTWVEEKLSLKDVEKAFGQLRSIMAFTGIAPRSPQGDALRAVFNKLSNFLGKLSGYRGMEKVDPKSCAICIRNIGRAFDAAVSSGFFRPEEIAPAKSLLIKELNVICDRRVPIASAAAALCLGKLEGEVPKPRAISTQHEDANDNDTTTLTAAPITTTTATATTPTAATTSTSATTTTTTATATTTGIARLVDAQEQKRRLDALKTSTPRNILAVAYKGGDFDVLFESVNPAGESGLKVLFAQGKSKELEVLANASAFQQAIWNVDKSRFGNAIGSLSDAIDTQRNPAAHIPWLEMLQQTFEPTEPVHGQMAALLNSIPRPSQANTSPRAPVREEGTTSTGKSQNSTSASRIELLPIAALKAGALKKLTLTKDEDRKVFFEQAVAIYATDDTDGTHFVPKDIVALEIPLNQPNANGQNHIRVVDLIMAYRGASTLERTEMPAQLGSELSRCGSTGRIRTREATTNAPDTPELKTPSLTEKKSAKATDVKAKPVPSRRASAPSNAFWFGAHLVFGMSLGLYLVQKIRQPLVAEPALLHLPTHRPGVSDAAISIMKERVQTLNKSIDRFASVYVERNSEYDLLLESRTLERNLLIQAIEYFQSMSAYADIRPAEIWDASVAHQRVDLYSDIAQFLKTSFAVGVVVTAIIMLIEHHWRKPS